MKNQNRKRSDVELLDAAIQKYERIKEIIQKGVGKKLHEETPFSFTYRVGNEYFGIRSNKCGLCQKYQTCSLCPIGARSKNGCGDTPWMEINNLLTGNTYQVLKPDAVNSLVKAIRMEITFLKKVKKGVAHS